MKDSPFGPYEPAVESALGTIDVPSMLAEELPQLRNVVWGVLHEQSALAAHVLSDADTHRSVRLLFHLAVNDFFDLLHDLQLGSGRSATRAARSVIEHAINMHTVADTMGNARRYVAHLDQGAAIALDLKVGVTRLEGPVRRAYVRSLRKVGANAQTRFEASVRDHGAWFRRGWVQANLADRASSYGLGEIYKFYKLASLVTHGSAGGSLGTIRDAADGLRTFRTGPALELAPVAMWAGVAGYREVLTGLTKVRTDINIDAFTSGLNDLDALWVDYFIATRAVDEAAWPDQPGPSPIAVLAFTKTRKRRWFLHLPLSHVLLHADDPELSDDSERMTSAAIEEAITNYAWMFRNDQRWLTMARPDVTVTPDGTGRWLPEKALLDMGPKTWENLDHSD